MFEECCPECGHLLPKTRKRCNFCGFHDNSFTKIISIDENELFVPFNQIATIHHVENHVYGEA